MTRIARILGCGSSGGVPRIGNQWGACDPNNPKNRRRRCSLFISQLSGISNTSLLIDTGPDMREQLLDAQIEDVDGVIYTHEHADHVHGIDDLRVLALQNRRRIDVYMEDRSAEIIRNRFAYCFETPQDSPYPPILNGHDFSFHDRLTLNGEAGEMIISTFPQHHGAILSTGIRVGGLAYSSDLHDIPEESKPYLQNLDVWIVDALRYSPHPSHFNLETALEWISYFAPKQAILTNMHVDLDYETLLNELPQSVMPAYDGMEIAF